MQEINKWLTNSKQRKIYNKCELYDWQKIEWSVIGNEQFPHAVEYNLIKETLSLTSVPHNDGFKLGYIHIKEDLTKDFVKSVLYISRGNIKAGNHFSDKSTILEECGTLDLKIYALVHKYLARYSGFITIVSKNDNIYIVSLLPDMSLKDHFSQSIKDHIK
jgi:hypothetical protein